MPTTLVWSREVQNADLWASTRSPANHRNLIQFRSTDRRHTAATALPGHLLAMSLTRQRAFWHDLHWDGLSTIRRFVL